jgi:hypothetical protein
MTVAAKPESMANRRDLFGDGEGYVGNTTKPAAKR